MALAYAKINLFLKLTGKRPNGYHELESLFAFLDLADKIEVFPNKTLSFNITGEFASTLNPQDNIIIKILDYFVAEFKISRDLKITLEKNIPVAAGLGGGSSDAATFMKILNEIFFLNLSKTELQKISTKFGSDIAFFFEDQTSIIRGCGEIITPFPIFTAIDALLINPKISLSTKEVFKTCTNKFSQEISDDELRKKNILELIANFPNELTEPAISKLPLIAEILHELKNQNAKIAKMSGSGASCFAIFADEKIEIAQKNIQQKFPQFFVKKVKICPRPAMASNQ